MLNTTRRLICLNLFVPLTAAVLLACCVTESQADDPKSPQQTTGRLFEMRVYTTAPG